MQEKKEKEYKKHIGAMIKFFGESAATLCYAAWTLVGGPNNEGGVNSDLHYDFPGQTPRSVFFFEGEEAKKLDSDVIDPAFAACLMANAATVSALADEWNSAQKREEDGGCSAALLFLSISLFSSLPPYFLVCVCASRKENE